MNYINITDIFGNPVSNNDDIPFLYIHSSKAHLIVEKIYRHVWRLINPTIFHILFKFGFDPHSYAPLGDIFLPTNKTPKKISILLVNVNLSISESPIDYDVVKIFNDFTLWKPIPPKGFRILGYVLSKLKPPLDFIRAISKKFVTPYRGKHDSRNNLTNMNEFNLLAYFDTNRKTLKRTKLLKQDNDILLRSHDGKYVTKTETGLGLKNSGQKINYSVQGELKVDDQCVGVSMDDNMRDNFVYLTKCDNSDEQKWYPYQNHFVSQFDQGCLTDSMGELRTTECENKKNKFWNMQPANNVVHKKYQKKNKSWKTDQGKNVILIESRNPWYLGRHEAKPIGIMKRGRKELNKTKYGNAKYHSNFMMDVHRPDMGYGYSYAQRGGRKCSCIEDCDKLVHKESIMEGFDGNSNTVDFNMIACSLSLVIFILVIIRLCVNRK